MVSWCSVQLCGLPPQLGCRSIWRINAGRCSLVSKEEHLSFCPHVTLRIANESKIACAPMSPKIVKTGPLTFAQHLLAPQGPDTSESGPSLEERRHAVFHFPCSTPGNLLVHLHLSPPVSPVVESCKFYFWGVRPLIRQGQGSLHSL